MQLPWKIGLRVVFGGIGVGIDLYLTVLSVISQNINQICP